MINEYPKHLTINGRLFEVDSRAAEDAVRAKTYPSEAAEKARLVAIAKKHGFSFDDRMTINQMDAKLIFNGYSPDEAS